MLSSRRQEIQSDAMDDTQSAAVTAVKAAMAAAHYMIRRHTCMHSEEVVIPCISVDLEEVGG